MPYPQGLYSKSVPKWQCARQSTRLAFGMAKGALDRLRYWKTRRCWRLRYPRGDGSYIIRLFGPTGVDEQDREAYAQAVLEASIWIDKHERAAAEKRDLENHREALKAAQAKSDLGLKMMRSASASYRNGETPREVALAMAMQGYEMDCDAGEEKQRLKQPQLRLINRIAELEPVADRVAALDEEASKLREENQHLRNIVIAAGRSAATESGPLKDLVEQFIDAHWAKLRGKGTQDKTMQPIRTSARKLVEYLAVYDPTIETSSDLEACPRALAEFRDSIVSQQPEKSSGWARKQLDGPKHFAQWLVARGYLSAMPRSITPDWMSVGVDEPCPTYFDENELRTLWWASEGKDRIRVLLILGMNAAYREADLVSLRAADIDLANREIRRKRNKTKRFDGGVPQCHRLWKTTVKVLRPWLNRKHDGYPFAAFKGVTDDVTAFIDATLPGNSELPYGERRTAKSLRSTAANMVEDLTGGDNPTLYRQMLGDKDQEIGKHYRRRNYDALYTVIDRMEQRLGI